MIGSGMKKLLKWIGGLVVLLVVVGIGLVVAANLLFDRKRDRVIKLEAKGVTVGSDEATLARGKYLFASRGCGDCHDADGAGRVFIDDPAGALRSARRTSRRRAWSPSTPMSTGCARSVMASDRTGGRCSSCRVRNSTGSRKPMSVR